MKQSHNSQQFIEQFNLIDKFFDHLLGNERFMPYNEKLKTIRQGGFALSRFVNIHQRELKYLGEIRNLLSHGLKIQGKELWCPTEHALTLLATYHDAITSPPTCYTLFKKPVYHAHMHDSLLGIVNNNIDHVHHIPLYDKGEIIAVLTYDTIVENISLMDNWKIATPQECNLPPLSERYQLIDRNLTIYEAETLFENNEKLRGLIITPNGKNTEHIDGIITRHDIPQIVKQLGLI